MTMPYYASPEQLMRDRSEYARKGISRGRSVAVVTYAGGVLFVAENPISPLHKVSEIYDRIGFAAVGRYNEFENLRVAGIRLADLRGYSYDRRDVTGRVIANAYAQTLGAIFTEQTKPYEVEICVAEVGDRPESDELYRLTFDGSVVDEPGFVVMGGQADAVTGHLREHFLPGMGLSDALSVGVRALSAVSPVTAGSGNGGSARLTAGPARGRACSTGAVPSGRSAVSSAPPCAPSSATRSPAPDARETARPQRPRAKRARARHPAGPRRPGTPRRAGGTEGPPRTARCAATSASTRTASRRRAS